MELREPKQRALRALHKEPYTNKIEVAMEQKVRTDGMMLKEKLPKHQALLENNASF